MAGQKLDDEELDTVFSWVEIRILGDFLTEKLDIIVRIDF